MAESHMTSTTYILTFSYLEHDGVYWYSLISEANDERFSSGDHLPQDNSETVDVTVWTVIGTLVGGGGGVGRVGREKITSFDVADC